FELVTNTKAKYGIADDDTYNFNKTGFIIGVIQGQIVFTGSKKQSNLKKMKGSILDRAAKHYTKKCSIIKKRCIRTMPPSTYYLIATVGIRTNTAQILEFYYAYYSQLSGLS
ncbi:hypothetical protein BU23DRAFT_477671, partial [Bimuria novae-zelandiae CBS 107.79]